MAIEKEAEAERGKGNSVAGLAVALNNVKE